MNDPILIIGAGPAGMAAAVELVKAGKKIKVIEKQSKVGGLSKTYRFVEGDKVFLTDNGPHRFFSKNKYLYNFVEDLIGEQWIPVKRQTRQFIDGKFYNYPIDIKQALRNLGIFKSIKIVLDYFWAQIVYKIFKKEIKSFTDYIIANFGRSLGEFNMINYTEKIWGVSATTIHPDMARQRIKGLNLISAVIEALTRALKIKNKAKPKSLVDVFYYPDSGTGLIYNAIKDELKKREVEVCVNSFPVKVNHNDDKIVSVELSIDGNVQTVETPQLVESIHIKNFIKLLSPQVPVEVSQACDKLRYRSQVYLFVTLDKKKLTDDQWIYFPNKNIPFGRVSEMKNFSSKMCSSDDTTSLFIEFFCFADDKIWNSSAEELFELSLPYFVKFGFFECGDVRKYYKLQEKDVYPIYDLEYEDNLKIIKDYLDKFVNLHYIGRPGRFRYNNQDHSLEMGILAARGIIEGKKIDIENVGQEKNYFESGYVPLQN